MVVSRKYVNISYHGCINILHPLLWNTKMLYPQYPHLSIPPLLAYHPSPPPPPTFLSEFCILFLNSNWKFLFEPLKIPEKTYNSTGLWTSDRTYSFISTKFPTSQTLQFYVQFLDTIFVSLWGSRKPYSTFISTCSKLNAWITHKKT